MTKPSITSCLSHLVTLPLAVLWMALFSIASTAAQTQNGPAGEDAPGNSAGTVDTSVGLSGIARLGHWTPIQIKGNRVVGLKSYRLKTLDGDNAAVNYIGDLMQDPEHPEVKFAWMRLGRADQGITLELYDANKEEQSAATSLESVALSLDSEDYLDSTQAEIVVAGGDDRIAQAFESALGGRRSTGPTRVTRLPSVDRLPPHWLGLDGVQTLVVIANNDEQIDNLSSGQVKAIQDWVQRGGKLILSVSPSAPRPIEIGGKLDQLCPGEFAGLSEFSNSSRLESFAESNDQLIPVNGTPIPVVTWKSVEGKTLVGDGQLPLIINQANGFGQVVVVSFDLQSELLTNWSSYNKLISKLVVGKRSGTQEKSPAGRSRGTVAHAGYSDIAGQLRIPLDQFQDVGFVAFTWIALLIGCYILCIGPLDYFVLRKLLGKMELTWITFPLMSLLFCGLAIGISQWTRPSEIQVNQLEIIDVDAVSGRTRGSVWTTLYSPSSPTVDLDLEPAHGLGFQLDESVVSWQGLPGSGLGGMSTRPLAVLDSRAYRQSAELTPDTPINVLIDDLPLQVSSSRAFFSQWYADNPVPIRSRPKLRTRSDRVTGAIKNPFDFEIRNCRLLVDTWAYVLNEPLGPGESFDIQTGTREKTLKNSLTRRSSTADQEIRGMSVAWDPSDTRVDRIADVMMFYQASGGDGYTGLTHDYQPFTDLSEHLNLNRAILVGQVSDPAAVLRLNGGQLSANRDQTTTMIRIILPVEIDDSR